MKIIKQGKLPSLRVWQGRCSNCGAVIEGTEDEMKNIQSDPRDHTRLCSMPCLCCKQTMFFYPKGRE